MVYLGKAGSWPTGGAPAQGPDGRHLLVPGWEEAVPIYRVLGLVPGSDPERTREAAGVSFRGSDVAGYVPCHLAEPQANGRFKSFPDAGAMVTLRDGRRFLLTVLADGRTTESGSVIGRTRDAIFSDSD